MHAKLIQQCPTLYYPMDYSLPGSSVQGILQARILEWVAMLSSGHLPDTGINLCLLHWQASSLLLVPSGYPRCSLVILGPLCMCTKSLQSCLTLCDPIVSSPLSSSVHGFLQVRILKWVAMPFSRGSSQPKNQTASLRSLALAVGFFTTRATRKPQVLYIST